MSRRIGVLLMALTLPDGNVRGADPADEYLDQYFVFVDQGNRFVLNLNIVRGSTYGNLHLPAHSLLSCLTAITFRTKAAARLHNGETSRHILCHIAIPDNVQLF